MRRIAARSDDHEIVVHDVAAVDAVAISDEFIFSDAIVNQQRVGIAAGADGERLPGSDRDDVNGDACRRGENRQDVAEQSRILGRSGRTECDEPLVGLCRNGGKNGHEEGNKTDHANHPLIGRAFTAANHLIVDASGLIIPFGLERQRRGYRECREGSPGSDAGSCPRRAPTGGSVRLH